MTTVIALLALAPAPAFAATPAGTTPLEGLRDASPRVHALVGARVVTAPGEVLERGTVVIRDGLIAAVGAEVPVPPDARVWDLAGRTVYAGFIESEAAVFLPAGWRRTAAPAAAAAEDSPALAAPAAAAPETAAAAGSAEAGARAWNPRVTPERRASRVLIPDTAAAEALRKLGFTVAHVTPGRGVFRGHTAAVSLGRGGFNRTVLRDTVAQPIAFEYSTSQTVRTYPTSLMGAVALARQTLHDAQWYAAAHARAGQGNATGFERPEVNDALAALQDVVRGAQPVIINAPTELDVQRAARLADEFKLGFILRGSGYEYRVLRDLPATRPAMIIPLTFPDPPEVEKPDHALDLSLDRLAHWELAPSNPARLAAAGVPVALTSSGLRRPETEFWTRVRLAIQHGLPGKDALAALTTVPARMLGLAQTHGTIAAGKTANLVIANADLFAADDSEIQLVWVDGDPFELDGWRRFDARGTWKLTWDGGTSGPAELKVTGRSARSVRAAAAGSDTAVRVEENSLSFTAPAKWFGLNEGSVRLTADAEGNSTLVGTGELPDGKPLRWRAERTAKAVAARTTPKKVDPPIARADVSPAGAYGRLGLPEQPAAVLVKNATIWTSGPAGTIEQGDLLVEAGRITRVGPRLAAPAGAIVIDATGKHVTPGLIDCHSHIAISGGVNEGSHSTTVEVRVGDVLDPTDIGLYRQLAGGLTTSNLLHGSANAMGGQNQVIKLRWGASAEELKFAGAIPGVKFALGENVTRKNSTTASTRYPVSRMGVREIMLDTFNRARDYEREWAEFRAGRAGLPPRRDLRLEAALEIARGERLIHIHSYRQDEILAFIRLAQELKLPVATFQHILEGYKVADEIAALGAGASAFSDWWAYKLEVIDAIPYAGALMHAAGVVVSFNSDSEELARRLNTEAAKAVKYGGLPPAEALKFVTINPARQLRIDARVGSLEAGKDADFVIWNRSPLSNYARVEQTWIDGRRYFDLAGDAAARLAAERERAALIQKILPERQKALGAAAPAAGRREPGADDEAKPGVLRVLAELAAAAGAEAHGLYHDGGHADTCSLHGGAHP